MPINRVFLGWKEPGLPAAADFLVSAAAGRWDFSQTIVAVPGGRAGRRLLEILVERAEQGGQALVPPEITTIGAIPEQLYRPQRPFATESVQSLVWARALQEARRDALATVFGRLPEDDETMRWLDLGDLLRRLHTELAADGLDFEKAAAATEQLGQADEARRWRLLAEIQIAYLSTLDGLGLWDKQTARLVAIERQECSTESQIVLIGMVDVDVAMRRMLDQVAGHVTALIVAPPELADRFDAHGCVSPPAWRDVPIDLAEDQVRVVEGPDEQADAVLRSIAELGGRFAAEDVTVGVPDESVVPHVQQRLAECELPFRYGVGRAVSQTGPYRLLEAAAAFVEGRRFADFATLVRHPAVEAWLGHRLARSNTPTPSWLNSLDEYHNEHLQTLLARKPGEQPAFPPPLRPVLALVGEMLRPLEGRPQPVGHWAEAIAGLLREVHGWRDLDREDAGDRVTISACQHLRDALAAMMELDEQVAPRLSSPETIEWLLQTVGGERIPPPADEAAIELLGWLELPLDDAPVLIATGMNEGFVPKSVNADLFLPNALRRALGLLDNDRRWARDAYALSLLAASRRRLTLIAGRRTAAGDPLAPSRLLLACDGPPLARRTLRFFDPQPPGEPAVHLPGQIVAARSESDFSPPPPRPLEQPIESLAVTRFRAFIECPYRFYLAHVLRLEAVDDTAEELDPLSFGSLAHEILQRLGNDRDLRECADETQIAEFLSGELDTLAAQRFGDRPLPAVYVQIEQLRRRLSRFARWQAGWFDDGWRIEMAEVDVPRGAVSLDVDGVPMGLHGRIDRIDRHQQTGQWIVFDYKTSDTAKSPQRTHFHRQDGWIDLQLPLYRHLVKSLGVEGSVELAYINLPKNLDETGHQPAGWTADELDEADEAAREVIRKIRAGEFWPPAEIDSPYDPFGALCGQGQFGAGWAAGRTPGDVEKGGPP